MCRFVAYLGDDILLEDVLVTPEDSLVKQSVYARESLVRTNGDGFGIGWYVPEISPEPGLFASVLPAWNDINLLYLASKMRSVCFFGHVRAANVGTVTHFNCHPFIYKQWMLMHNGDISDFSSIKLALCNLLDQDIYSWIKGQTDSEHLFALFIQLAKNKDLTQLSVVADVLEATLDSINTLLEKAGKTNKSYFNLCVSDGQRLVATRYCVDKTVEPESLHYLMGPYFSSLEASLEKNRKLPQRCVLIASETLTGYNNMQWISVPPGYFILVERDLSVELRAIK